MLAEPHHHVWAKSETWCIGEGMDIKRNVGSLVGRGGVTEGLKRMFSEHIQINLHF